MEKSVALSPHIKVACILDDFSYQCLKYECNLIQLDTKNWLEILSKESPQLLLVESAWLGTNDSWYNKICNINITEDVTLKSLTTLCNKLKIPTVFWNKEDPYHFDDFIETAKLFDYVFTTDENCLERYKKILQHSRVYTLPFAAQPKIHNPIGKDEKKIGDVAFAGGWYNIGHHNRRKDMEYILEPALNYNLDIYDRHYTYNITYTNNYYRFPETYTSFIKGFVTYKSIAELYKKYSIFLNVNSVTDSPTMFSRRVFELLACGTNVVSSHSPGIEKIFPEIVKLSRNKDDTIKHLEILIKDKELRDRLSLLGQREIFNHHTYTLRLETILDKLGISYKKIDAPKVSIISYIDKEDSLNLILENYERQIYKNKELIVILNNNSLNLKSLKNKSKNYKDVKILETYEKKTLVQALNYAIENSNLEYIAIFNSDYYGENYLVDMMNTFKYSNSDIVGKCSHYAYSKNYKLLAIILPHMENRYVPYVKFSTMVIKKKVFDVVKFSETSQRYDVEFLKNCIDKGFSIYATDRFNYVSIKYASPKKQTYKVKDLQSSKKIKIIGYKDNYINDITV